MRLEEFTDEPILEARMVWRKSGNKVTLVTETVRKCIRLNGKYDQKQPVNYPYGSDIIPP